MVEHVGTFERLSIFGMFAFNPAVKEIFSMYITPFVGLCRYRILVGRRRPFPKKRSITNRKIGKCLAEAMRAWYILKGDTALKSFKQYNNCYTLDIYQLTPGQHRVELN